MPTIRNSFMTIFIWTLLFSFLSVFFSFWVAFLLANILNWGPVRFKPMWRSLLLLPYAVPAFISILIFRGLFNPDQGEINMVLEYLFGIRPLWTTSVGLARFMVIFVNVWLSYPFLFILITGLLHSVPLEIYEASAIDGGNSISNTFRITIPLILRPLTPILILVYALQFNNYLLVHLLTSGNPAISGAASYEGYTDILVTFVYKVAFMDTGTYFGLASAIGTLIFIVIAIFSYINLKLFHKHDDKLY